MKPHTLNYNNLSDVLSNDDVAYFCDVADDWHFDESTSFTIISTMEFLKWCSDHDVVPANKPTANWINLEA